MAKVIVTEMGGVITEHWGKTFDEVLRHAVVPMELYLDYYNEDEIGFKTFKRRVNIGNTAENLTRDDYYKAYDIVTE